MENYDHISDYIKNGIKDEETRLLISDFAILWNIYEKECFKLNYKPYKIKGLFWSSRKKFENREESFEELFVALLNYFKERYIAYEAKSIIDKFKIGISDLENAYEYKNKVFYNVEEVVVEEECKKRLNKIILSERFEDKIFFMLLITGRVRNNMFHGIKDIEQLRDQKNLFIFCNQLLNLIFDIKGIKIGH